MNTQTTILALTENEEELSLEEQLSNVERLQCISCGKFRPRPGYKDCGYCILKKKNIIRRRKKRADQALQNRAIQATKDKEYVLVEARRYQLFLRQLEEKEYERDAAVNLLRMTMYGNESADK